MPGRVKKKGPLKSHSCVMILNRHGALPHKSYFNFICKEEGTNSKFTWFPLTGYPIVQSLCARPDSEALL